MKPLFTQRALPLVLSLAAGLSACALPPATPKAQLAPAQPATLGMACEDLAARLADLPQTRIASVTTVAAGALKVPGQTLPEHCWVQGAMQERKGPLDGLSYAIGFEMRLPKAWNGRFWYQANGGIDGTVHPAVGALGGGPLTSALAQGFAVISSDAGHNNRITRGPGFGIDPQSRLDYGYQAVGSLTPMAKALIQRAYGKAPDRSYFGGCSNGGRHAMVAATRYADQYDGFLVGAPGYRLPLAAIANVFGAQQYARVATDPKDLSTAFTDAERRTVANAALKACDALDGLADGMIQDTAACAQAFNFQRDVPTCTGARDGSCLSAAQKAAIAPIFSGATTENGQAFYASFPVDAGLAGAGVKNWEFTAPLKLDSGAIGLIWSVPPQNPKTFKPTDYVLNTPISQLLASVQATNDTYRESALSFMMPVNPENLRAVQQRGGKVMAYHGNSDAIFSANDTQLWYEQLQATHGASTADFARFFRVPGMDHCRGGPSTDQFDMITPLVQWVEQGQAPQQVVAHVRGAGHAGGVNNELPAGWSAQRSRPLCPWPQVARYVSGDPEAASSFQCR
jgi:poly(3-hydroxybutyrate) depolymerase